MGDKCKKVNGVRERETETGVATESDRDVR